MDVKPDAVVVPAGTELTSSLPAKSNGIKYTTKYGIVGLNFMGKHMVVDGMNEKGLYAGALYLPGYASYPKVEAKTASKSMAPEDYVAWVLGNFATVAEVKENYKKVILVQNPQKEIGGQSFPDHFLITDGTGASVVIEPLEGGLKIYDNPLGVLTNSVADLKNLDYAVKTYKDQSIRNIDVKKALDAAKGEIKVIKLKSEQAIDDISTKF